MFGSDQALNIIIRARDDASKTLNSLQGRIEKLQPTFRQMSAVGTVAFAGIATGIGYVVRQAANMEQLMKGLEAVAGSAEAANEQFTRLREVAKLPGLGLEEAIRGSINLQAAGLSANLAERSIKAFGNALATVGKGKAELDGVVLALQQISAKGKISAEEINQLNERLPQIRKAMQDAFGTADTEVLQKMGIGAEEFVTKITAQFEKLPPVTGGFNVALENLQDNLKILAVTIGGPFIEALGKIVIAITPMVEKLSEWVEAHPKLTAAIISAAAAVSGLLAVVGLLGMALPALITGFAFITGPVGIIIASIAGLILIFRNLNEIVKLFQTDSALVWAGIKIMFKDGVNFLTGMAESFANVWVKAVNFVIGALNKLKVSVPDWVPGIGGKSWGINIPKVAEVSLPKLEHGGFVPGAEGTEVPIIAHGGERILTARNSQTSDAGNVTINFINPQVKSREDINYLREQVEQAFRDVTRGHKLNTI